MQDLTGFVGGVGDWIKAKTLAVDLLDDAALSSDPVPAMALVGRATYLGNVFRGYPDKSWKITDATGLSRGQGRAPRLR